MPAIGMLFLFFFNDPATTEIYTLSLHDALPIWFVVTVPAEKGGEFEKLLSGNVWARIGQVRDDKRFLIRGLDGQLMVEIGIDELKEAYKKTLRF